MAVFVIAALVLIMKFVYKSKLAADAEAIKSVMELDENKAIEDKALLYKSIVVMILVVVGFMFHSQLGD